MIFHDDNLGRFTGDPRKLSEVTEEEMRVLLAGKGRGLLTLADRPFAGVYQFNRVFELEIIEQALIADIVFQLLSYVAQTEREFIRQRQREGIEAER